MSAAVIGLIAAFVVLWFVTAFWTRGGSGASLSQRRAGWALAIFGMFFLAAAWWWRVPLDAQKSVITFANSPSQSGGPFGASSSQGRETDCAVIMGTAKQLDAASSGNLNILEDGSVIVRPVFWNALSANQKEPIIDLARQIANCAQVPSTGVISIRDRDSDAIIAEE